MDAFFWDGVEKLPLARPRSILFEAYGESWHDTTQTMMKINLLQYRDGNRLEACASFDLMTPNHLIAATLEYPFKATACDVVFLHDAHACYLKTLPSGGIFPRPCLSLPGTTVDLFSGMGGWHFGLLLAETSMNIELPPMRFAVDINQLVESDICTHFLCHSLVRAADSRYFLGPDHHWNACFHHEC